MIMFQTSYPLVLNEGNVFGCFISLIGLCVGVLFLKHTAITNILTLWVVAIHIIFKIFRECCLFVYAKARAQYFCKQLVWLLKLPLKERLWKAFKKSVDITIGLCSFDSHKNTLKNTADWFPVWYCMFFIGQSARVCWLGVHYFFA